MGGILNVTSQEVANNTYNGVLDTLSGVLGDKYASKLAGQAGDIAAMELDRGAAFLMGATTSAISASPVGYAVGGAINTMNKIFDATELMDICKDKLIDGINDIAVSYLTKITALPAKGVSYLTERTAYWTGTFMNTPDKLLEGLMKLDKFSFNAENAQNALKDKLMSAQTKLISDTQKKITDKISYKMSGVNDFITNISAYTSEGIDWVMDKMSSYTDVVLDDTGKFIGTQYNVVESEMYKAIDTVASTVGQTAAEKINEVQKKLLEKKLQKVEVEKTKGINKGKAAIKKALLKLKALMGG